MNAWCLKEIKRIFQNLEITITGISGDVFTTRIQRHNENIMVVINVGICMGHSAARKGIMGSGIIVRAVNWMSTGEGRV